MVIFEETFNTLDTEKVLPINKDTLVLKIQVLPNLVEPDPGAEGIPIDIQLFGSLNGTNYDKISGLLNDGLTPISKIVENGVFTFDISGLSYIKILKSRENACALIGVG